MYKRQLSLITACQKRQLAIENVMLHCPFLVFTAINFINIILYKLSLIHILHGEFREERRLYMNVCRLYRFVVNPRKAIIQELKRLCLLYTSRCV